MSRIYGSGDLFPDDLDNAYHPYQTINYVASHDGFCLYDLVAYNVKHNPANGQNNSDGTENNLSWNCGCEGDQEVPAEVMERRKQQIKKFLCDPDAFQWNSDVPRRRRIYEHPSWQQ